MKLFLRKTVAGTQLLLLAAVSIGQLTFDMRKAIAQSANRPAGSSYISPLSSDSTSFATAGIAGSDNPVGGLGNFSNSGHDPYRDFSSVTNIERSNPYTSLSSPSSLNSQGQFLGRGNLDPDSLNRIARPDGLYGNMYDSRSTIINPYSQYGSTNNVSSAVNPYAAGTGPLLNSHDQRPTFPNYERLGGGIQRWYP